MSLALLTAADLRQIAEAGYRAQEAGDPEVLAEHVQEVLHRMIGAELVVWNELTADGKVSTGMTFPELPAAFWTEVAPGMLAHIHEHPFVQKLGEQRDRAFTAAISDLLPTSRFVQTGLYAVGYREFAAKFQISSALGTADGGYLVVSLNRRASDFSARDKAILDAITRQAARAYHSLRLIEGLRDRLRQARRGTATQRASWLYLDSRLIVKWGAPDLDSFLRDHFQQPRSDIFLPDPLATMFAPLVAGARRASPAAPRGGITRHLRHGGKNYRLSLVDERVDRFRLTITQTDPAQDREPAGSGGQRLSRREAEAAHWASLGKTNPEIATILGISSRTVEKHVHAALAKLGFENRVQMARWAAENGDP